MQAYESKPASRLCEPVCHADHGTLVKAQDVAEVRRIILKEWQLVGTGIPKNGGNASSTQELESHVADSIHNASPFATACGGTAFSLALNERKEIRVDHIGMDGQHPVRIARIDLERAVLQQLHRQA